jgi:hypothetical protein
VLGNGVFYLVGIEGKMPNQKDYDLDLKPNTYWVFSGRKQWVQAIVKVDARRLLADHTLDDFFPIPYEPFNPQISQITPVKYASLSLSGISRGKPQYDFPNLRGGHGLL